MSAKYADLKERIETVDDDRAELLVTFWDSADDYDPIEASGFTRVLVVPDAGEPFTTNLCAFACDSVVNTSTATVRVDGETYEVPGEGSLHRLETLGGTDVYVPRDRICRVLQVPRSGRGEIEETMGFLPEADPFTED